MYRFVIIFLGFAVNSGWCVPPTITFNSSEFLPYAGKDLVVEEGNDFTLRCEGSTRVNWTYYPPPQGLIDFSSYVNITGWYDSTEGKYVSTIRVYSRPPIDYVKMGYYFCSNEKAKILEDTENVARIYVYVKGEGRLFLGIIISGTVVYQNDTILIPCRPTTPDSEVELLIDNKKVNVGNQKTRNKLNVAFDPKFGFTFKNVNFNNSTNFECHALQECTDKPCNESHEYFDLGFALHSNKSVEFARLGPNPWFGSD